MKAIPSLSQRFEAETSAAGSRAPIRVLELAGSVALYGAERWILALVKHLDRDRIQPIIAAIEDGDGHRAPLCEAASSLGVQSLVIKAPGRFNINAVRQVRRLIYKLQVSIVHSHGYKGDVVGRLATWRTPCKILSTPHGWTHDPDFKLLFYEYLDRAVFPFMDAVVPLSSDLHQRLRCFPGVSRKLRLISNAVDLAELRSETAEAPEVKAWKSKGRFVIGYIGRLIGAKGVATLLRAVRKMGTQEVHVALVGNGPDEGSLKEITASLGISDRVTFFGYREDRLSYIKGFDLLALPSLSEGTPRCLMEAMGLGIPVVASDIPGCRALIEDGHTGILFPPGNDCALAAALSSLLSDPDKRTLLAAAAKHRIFTHFSAKRMADEYMDLFFGLARSSI